MITFKTKIQSITRRNPKKLLIIIIIKMHSYRIIYNHYKIYNIKITHLKIYSRIHYKMHNKISNNIKSTPNN